MKPEHEWFRPPSFSAYDPVGDHYRFFWVAEPEPGKGCYGVFYEVSRSDMIRLSALDLTDLRHQARAELTKRIEAGDKHSEGSLFEVFRWFPPLKKESHS